MSATQKNGNNTMLLAGIAALVGGYFLLSTRAANATTMLPAASDTAIPGDPGTKIVAGEDDDSDDDSKPGTPGSPLIKNSISDEDVADAAKDRAYESGSPKEDEDSGANTAMNYDTGDDTDSTITLPGSSSKHPVKRAIVKPVPFVPIKAGQKSIRVRQLQQKMKIPVTGVFDALTAATLQSRYHATQITSEAQFNRILSNKPVVVKAGTKIKLVQHPVHRVTAKQPIKQPLNAFPMQLGSRGERVALLQRKLGLKADGIFGKLTQATLQARYKTTRIMTVLQYNQILAMKIVPAPKKPSAAGHAHPLRHPVKVHKQAPTPHPHRSKTLHPTHG